MDWLTSPETWIALLTLTALEIVLGIDNIVFISILSARLPADWQPKAPVVGAGTRNDHASSSCIALVDYGPNQLAFRDRQFDVSGLVRRGSYAAFFSSASG